MAANKLDYSRLLDDEFLNRTPERGRCRGATVSRGAAEVLGLQAALPAGAGPSRLTVFLYGAAMSAAVLISIVFALLLVHAHQEGVQRLQSLGLPFAQRLAMDAAESSGTTTPAPKAGDDRGDSKEHDYDHVHVHDHAYDHDHEHDGDHDHALHDHALHDHALHDHAYDHDHEHDGDHDHALHGAADETAHHVALSGGFDAAADEHEHAQGIHEHINSGDVVLEDHHIVPAGDPEPTPHVLLLCLPLPLEAPAEANATNATESTVRLSRAQRDVVHSVAEYLSETARCYLIALRGVEAEGRTNTTTPSAAPGPAPAPSNRTAPQLVGFRTGCGSPEDAGDELDGAEAGGDVVLSTGRKVPVVFWDAATLFTGSPLTAVWRGLRQRRAAGSTSTSTSTSSAAAAGPDLLGVAGRLQLLWRYGGLSMDLDTSTDRALKALSAYNRTDTAHVYLETTRAVLLAAPQTCNAVVFDLIRAITKQSEAADAQRNRVPDTQEVEHYDVADVKVFDGVLNEYCRGGRRRARSAAVTPSTTTTESYTPTAATPPAETPPSTATSIAAPAPSTRAPPAHARATFNMLRAGPPVPPTTPQPLDIRVDTTHCKGNLVAISLA